MHLYPIHKVPEDSIIQSILFRESPRKRKISQIIAAMLNVILTGKLVKRELRNVMLEFTKLLEVSVL